MDSYDSRQNISGACPPAYSEDSLFFNLILGTNYENTKDNCLLFLRNYSRNNMFYPKREIFKLLINELILNESSNNVPDSNECVYLMRQVIKKYSKNNILNALYDYIIERDNYFFPPILDNYPNNTSAESSLNKLQSSQSDKDSKSIINNNFIISQEMKKKENNENAEYEDKNKKLLSRKRQYPDKIKKKNKKKKKGNANKKLIKKTKVKKGEAHKEQEKEEVNKRDEEVPKGNGEDNHEEIKIKSENIENEGKKEEEMKKVADNKEKEKNKEDQEPKNEAKKEESNPYKMKLRKLPLNKSNTSHDSLNNTREKGNNSNSLKRTRFSSGEKISKKEFKLHNSMQSSLIDNNDNNSPNSQKDKYQMNIMSYLNEQKDKNNEKGGENKYSAHLIKYDSNVYSYNIKRSGGIKNNIIYFECNNRKCKGKGEYDMEKKIFHETFKHSIVPSSHNISFLYYSMRDKLLEDKETVGYQIFKDNSFIKDDKVVFLN